MTKQNDSPAFTKNLETLQKNYLKRLAGHLAELRRFEQRVATQHITTADIQQFYRLTHNFAGSGSTFGFPQISVQARLLHQALGAYGESDRTPASHEYELLQVTLLAFINTCREALHKPATKIGAESAPVLVHAGAALSAVIGVFGSDATKANDLVEGLRNFGYEAQHVANFEELYRVAGEANSMLAAIIVSDLSASERARLESITQFGPAAIPLIIMTPSTDFETRLFAAQHDIQGCFAQDADLLQIIEKFEQLSARYKPTPPYRVLIVDDDEMLGEFYSHTLRNAGMHVVSLNTPKAALTALDAQPFDLILIDYTMPDCSGPELASIIRQQSQHVSLPIVFMSAKNDMQAQLVHSGIGIDDFLVKPFSPEQMVAVVTSRARRAAELKQLMVRDSLTGLLNHARFLELLEQQRLLATRSQSPGVLAMIDLDHFKTINDQHGHALGDTVLRGFSRLMQQRMRRTDMIGRIGGEEFAIILPHCELDMASAILNDLRMAFGKLQFQAGQHAIKATFSAGLALLSAHGSLIKIYEAADGALYRAKQAGRDCVVAG